jgi:plastocyanin
MCLKQRVFCFARSLSVLLVVLWRLDAGAATTNVNVENYDFSPASVTINVNDSVEWDWVSGLHSSTSSSGLWDSTEQSAPASYTLSFPSIGNYPYFCTVHQSLGMAGSVTVLSPGGNVSVNITSPTNGAIFAAPWNGTLQATVTDFTAPISKVEFFINSASFGKDTTAPYSRGVTNLPAGNYVFTAVATDNLGASNVSPAITVSVIAPSPLILSGPRRLSPTQFEFSHTADPGLRYMVQRSSDFSDFTTILTYTATEKSVGILDNSAGARVNFYRVILLPNP